jgi:hypothetical protein
MGTKTHLAISVPQTSRLCVRWQIAMVSDAGSETAGQYAGMRWNRRPYILCKMAAAQKTRTKEKIKNQMWQAVWVCHNHANPNAFFCKLQKKPARCLLNEMVTRC